MAAKKDLPMLPAKTIAPCASSGCRFPGRLWVRTLEHNERFCVNHYYRAIEADSSLGLDDTVPPKSALRGRPVAGRD